MMAKNEFLVLFISAPLLISGLIFSISPLHAILQPLPSSLPLPFVHGEDGGLLCFLHTVILNILYKTKY